MEQWDKNYYITSIAGANNGSALVVMSQGRGIFPSTFFFFFPGRKISFSSSYEHMGG